MVGWGWGCGWTKECLCEEVIHIFYDALHRCVPIPCKSWVPSALPQCSMGLEAHQEGKEVEEILSSGRMLGPFPGLQAFSEDPLESVDQRLTTGDQRQPTGVFYLASFYFKNLI